MNEPAQLTGIDRATLTPVVRRALGSDTAEAADWQVSRLHGGAVTLGTGGGVYHLKGTAPDRGEFHPWRVVLKVSPPFGDEGQHGEPSSMYYWKRELLVYESGLLQDLPAGLTAPCYFGGTVLAPNTLLLWLEYVEDAYAAHWPLERYHLAAQHIGRLNGQYLTAQPLPSVPWLARKGLQQEQMRNKGPRFITDVQAALDQRRLHSDLSPTLCEALLKVCEKRDMYLSVLDRLPQTLGHRETFKRNLLARRDEFGNDQTVLIDWTHAGVGPLGEDLSSLVFYTVLFCDVEASNFGELAEGAYEGYLAGLRDVGWRGDLRLPRLGYCLTAALHFGLWQPMMCFASDLPEDRRRLLEHLTRRPIAEVRAHFVEGYRRALDCAREAEGLVAALW